MLLFYCFIAQLHGARLFICILWFQASFIAHFSCLFLVTKYCMLSVHTDPVSAHSCETFCIVNKCWMTFKMTGQFGMKLLKRPLTVIFKIPKTGRLTEEEVLNEILAAGVKTASIRCIQLTPNKGFVTMNCQDSHSALLGIRIYKRAADTFLRMLILMSPQQPSKMLLLNCRTSSCARFFLDTGK